MFFTKRNLLTSFVVLTMAALPLSAKASVNSARIVDFGKCLMESAFGKSEQENFNKMKEQMESSIKDLSDQLTEVQTQLEDEFTVDSLTPEAEEEKKAKQQTLAGEIQRCQMQYPQILQQAQNRSMQVFAEKVKIASSKLAKEKRYTLIINKDQVFHYTSELDVTADVIVNLDKMHSEEAIASEKVKNEISSKDSKKVSDAK